MNQNSLGGKPTAQPTKTLETFENPNAKRDAVIVITGDRGLCGGFNSNIIKYAESFLAQHDRDVDLYLFGNKSISHFKSKQWTITESKSNFYDSMTLPEIEKCITPILEKYKTKEYNHCTKNYYVKRLPWAN